MSAPQGTETTESAPKKGRKLIILALPLLLILLGGGTFWYFYLSSSAADNEKSAKAEKNYDEEDSHSDEEKNFSEETGKKKSSKKSSHKEALPSDEDVKQIVELQPFVVNLTDPDNDRYLRLTVSVGVGEDDGGHGKPDILFTTRIRNAMLAVLTLKSSDDVLTVEGKAKLRKELLKAAQSASEHPHVEAIYITDFIVQL